MPRQRDQRQGLFQGASVVRVVVGLAGWRVLSS